jgi:hypothetical protein
MPPLLPQPRRPCQGPECGPASSFSKPCWQHWPRQLYIQPWLQSSVQRAFLGLRLGQANGSPHRDTQEQQPGHRQGFQNRLALGRLNRDLHGYGHGSGQAKQHAPGQERGQLGGMPGAGGLGPACRSGPRAKLQLFKELHLDGHSLGPLQASLFPNSGT